MSNVFQRNLKNKAEELRKVLKDFVFDEYIKGDLSKLNSIDVKKIENDLGYMYFAIEDTESSATLDYYKNLINTYSKQLKLVIREK
ncbi:hypothetical protein [uncultured Clostridium sp.]|uniref:hypothetical protein n=1 Tax=uncultured Clostridium sp. TaxID=59620 RepID=UPI003217F279